MLKFIAYSCVRNGRKTWVRVTGFSHFYSAGAFSIMQSSMTASRSLRLLPRLLLDVKRRTVIRATSFTAGSNRNIESTAIPTTTTASLQTDFSPDHFGSLSTDIGSRTSFRKSTPDTQNMKYEEDEEDEGEELAKSHMSGRRNTPYWYFLQCKKLIKENKLQQALDLFSTDMLKVERLQPEEYNYTVLIGGCGRAGQLKKAFKLYNDMKKRALIPTDPTYTALFNACAESPWQQRGLEQATLLEQELRRKNYRLSKITYHALLKTHAVTNHLQACLQIFKEMLQDGHLVTQETFHYLLMGCLKDKKTGFRLALQIWQQMLVSKICPDSNNYNLLLRIARDCDIGDPMQATNILLNSNLTSRKRREDKLKVQPHPRGRVSIDIDLLERRLLIQADHHSHNLSQQSNSFHGSDSYHNSAVVPGEEETPYRRQDPALMPVVMERPTDSPSRRLEASVEAPNLLNLFVGKGEGIVSLGTISGATDRLALIGGAKGLLEKMEDEGLCPDIRTLTLLADTMTPGKQSLQLLLRVAKQYNVKLDIAFFNSVIRQAAKSDNMDEAKAVLGVMRQRHVNVNVQTYGCLALGCKQQQDGLQLLEDMEEAGLRPNVYVFSALIGRAAQRLDYIYLKALLMRMAQLKVWPNEIIIKQLEFAAKYPPNYDQYKTRNNYLIHINAFRGYYQEWLKFMPAQSAEAEQINIQPEHDQTAQKTEPRDDGLNVSQRNQQAAARRYHSRKKDKQRSTGPPS